MERTKRLPGTQPHEILESVKKFLIDERPANFGDCVKWARLLWEENFNNQIQQLLFNFPADQTTSTGQAFWSGPKRCPRALSYDQADPLSNDFIYAAANLRAEMYGIPQNRDKFQVTEMAAAVEVILDVLISFSYLTKFFFTHLHDSYNFETILPLIFSFKISKKLQSFCEIART